VDQMTVEFKKGLQFHFHSRFGQSRFRINSFGYIEKKKNVYLITGYRQKTGSRPHFLLDIAAKFE
jgi:hypothetical protein